jgi:hypothetical protein
MSAPAWPRIWKRYPFHRKANATSWDKGEAQARTAKKEKSQYNPHLYATDDQVRELEERCVDTGILISDFGIKRTYYLKTDHVIGVCRGELTSYVFAEWHQCGDIHGRPISEAALRNLGVKL